MTRTSRVDKKLFTEDHYLGKPADEEDKIVGRRIHILERYPEFFDQSLSCIEVGCGSGATINRIAHRFDKCLGVDIYDYSASFKTQQEKYSAVNSRFIQIDMESENIGEQFDRLISFEVIEHLRKEDSIKKYYDVLKPGGLIAISVPNKWWIFETHGARLPLLPWNRVPFFSWLPRVIHERYANARIYTVSRITGLLQKHGFEVIDSCYITAPMDVLRNGRLKRFLVKYIFGSDSTTMPTLSTSIFVLAQKKHTDA